MTRSLWPRLAGLPLVVEACEYDRLHAVLAYEFDRVTTHVRLVGGGVDGLGEDVSAFREDGTTLHETRPALGLEGEWTLGGFCEHLATLGGKDLGVREAIDAPLGIQDHGSGIDRPGERPSSRLVHAANQHPLHRAAISFSCRAARGPPPRSLR